MAVPAPLSAQSARRADESWERRQPRTTRKCALGRSLRSRQSGLAHGTHHSATVVMAVAMARAGRTSARPFCANAPDIHGDGSGAGGVYSRLFGSLAEAAAKLPLCGRVRRDLRMGSESDRCDTVSMRESKADGHAVGSRGGASEMLPLLRYAVSRRPCPTPPHALGAARQRWFWRGVMCGSRANGARFALGEFRR